MTDELINEISNLDYPAHWTPEQKKAAWKNNLETSIKRGNDAHKNIGLMAAKFKRDQEARDDESRDKLRKELSNEEIDLDEELTDKTIRSSDKVKVARVIADMLGVENVESMSPELAVNTGLRLMRSKRMTPDLIGVLRKMLNLASELGIKVDRSLIPKAVSESVESDEAEYLEGLINFKDYLRANTIGSSLHPNKRGQADDHLRHRKIRYKVDEEIDKQDYDQHHISDAELDKMAHDVDDENDIIHAYDDDELVLIDADTGEEVETKKVNEEALDEVMSRAERMRAKIRFARTQSKRSRKLQIILKRRSDAKTINHRARRLAIKLIKERIIKKPLQQMSVAEKERAELIVNQRRGLINKLALRLVPRVRKIESDRLSHQKVTKTE